MSLFNFIKESAVISFVENKKNYRGREGGK